MVCRRGNSIVEACGLPQYDSTRRAWLVRDHEPHVVRPRWQTVAETLHDANSGASLRIKTIRDVTSQSTTP